MPEKSKSQPRRAFLGLAAGTTALTALEACSPSNNSKQRTTPILYARDYKSIQNAIDAAQPGSIIQLDPGKHDGRLEISKRGITLAGSGSATTILSARDAELLTISDVEFVDGLVVTDLRLDSGSGGHSIVNIPFGLTQSVFQRVHFIQRDPQHQILSCLRKQATGGLFEARFTGCYFQMPFNSVVPGIEISGPNNPASANMWDSCRARGGGTYLFHLEAGGKSYCYDNVFDSMVFEEANHGAIRVLGGLNTVLRTIGMFDNKRIDSDVVVLGKGKDGLPTRSTSIENYHRSTGSLDAGAVDIRFRSGENRGPSLVIKPSGPPAANVTIGAGGNQITVIGHDPDTVHLTDSGPDTASVLTSSELSVPRARIGTAEYLNGTGSPEGLVSADVGALYTRRDGKPGQTLYVKESGSGLTGWASK